MHENKAIFAIAATVLFLAGAHSVMAAVTVTAATGGSAISADTNITNGTAIWTTLAGPTITETAARSITPGSGTIVLTRPSGFSFNASATVTATIVRDAGNGTCFTFSSNAATPTTSTITYILTARDGNGNTICHATFSNIQVRPNAGTPLASGNITNTGSNASVPSGAGNNYGTVTEVAGAKNKLVYTTQPAATATTSVAFAADPVVKLEDQYGNTELSDNASTVSLAPVLSTQACGGTTGNGTLTSTPASGAAVTAGVMTYTAIQYSFGESIKICATSAGVASALSNTVAVSNPAPATTSISPTSTTTTAGGTNFTLTVNGTNFVSNSSVQINGVSRATAFVSGSRLTAAILAGDIAVGATTSITVVNPAPGGGTSNSQTLTVFDLTPPAAITDLAAISASDSTVGLSWTAPGDDGATGTAASYDMRYSTSTITDGNFDLAVQASGTPAPAVAGTAQSMNITGLAASTAYFFAMKTADEVPNVSAISNVASATTTVTPDTAPPAAITDLAVTSASAVAANLAWTAPGDDGATGIAASYDVRYSTSTITAVNFSSAASVPGAPAPAAAGTVQSMAISGLDPSTIYFFAIKTSDEVPNISAISNVVSAVTGVAGDIVAPAPVADLAITSVSASTATLAWTAPGDDGTTGIAASYDIRYATSAISVVNFGSATAIANPPIPAIAGTVQTVTVAGLVPDTAYFFAMKAADEVPNISGISNVVSSSTAQAVQPAAETPQTNVISSPTQGSAPARAFFEGQAYPGAAIEVLRKTTVDPSFAGVPFASVAVDPQGIFRVTLQNFLQADYFFALRAKDPQGRSSGILSFPRFFRSGYDFSVNDIIFTPTLEIQPSAVPQGDTVVLTGTGVPGATIEPEVDGSLKAGAVAGSQGSFNIALPTAAYAPGSHQVRARDRLPDGTTSDFSPAQSFQTISPTAPKGDLNHDGAINVADWSIFLFRWNSSNSALRGTLDLNGDGRVDTQDLSIFLQSMAAHL